MSEKVYVCGDCHSSFNNEFALRFHQTYPNMACVERQRDALRDELIEAMESVMENVGAVEARELHKGWTFTMGMSDAAWAGDRLVELGAWEAHPGNTIGSKVNWYRRKPK